MIDIIEIIACGDIDIATDYCDCIIQYLPYSLFTIELTELSSSMNIAFYNSIAYHYYTVSSSGRGLFKASQSGYNLRRSTSKCGSAQTNYSIGFYDAYVSYM